MSVSTPNNARGSGHVQQRQPGQQVQGDASYGRVEPSGPMPWYQKFNDGMNNFYYKLGIRIGSAPTIFFVITLIAALLCMIGFTKLYSEGDIYKLWIEKSSRLVPERKFNDDHFASVTSRAAYLYGYKKNTDNVLTSESLQEWYDVHQEISNISIVYKDQTYTRDDICDRTANPPALQPFFRASGLKGFQCFRLTILDCFDEGSYDATPATLVTFIPTEMLTLPDSFRRVKNAAGVYVPTKKPSFKNQTLDVLRDAVHGSCTQWADSLIPENFLMGGVVRNPALGSLPIFPRLALNAMEPRIEKVSTYQSLLSVKTYEKMGKDVAASRCNKGCNDGCDLSVKQCQGSCYQGFVTCSSTYCYPPCIPMLQQQQYVGCGVTYNTTVAVNCTKTTTTGNTTTTSQNQTCIDNASQTQSICQQMTMSNESIPIFQATCGKICQSCPLQAGGCALNCAGTLGYCAAMCNGNCTGPTQTDNDDGKNIISAWEKAYITRLGMIKDKYKTLSMSYFSDRSTGDLVDEATAADTSLIVLGYVFMIIYAIFCTFKCSTLWSKTWVATVGVLLVCLSTAASMGLSAAFGVDFSPQIIQVLPALILGLGVNDMFIMVYTFRYDPAKSVEVMAADMLHEMGASTALASFTNCIAFAIGATIPLPSVSTFSLAALVGIALNYFILLFAFTAILVFDAKRIARGNMDWLCCIRSNTSNTEIEPRDTNKGLGPLFARHMIRIPLQILAVVGTIILLSVAAVGINKIEVGLPLSDIVPKDSYASTFLNIRETYYAETPAYVYIGMTRDGHFQQLDYGSLQKPILDMERQMDAVKNTNPILTMSTRTFWDSYILWVNAAIWTDKYPTGYVKKNFTDALDFTTTYNMSAAYPPVYLLKPTSFNMFLSAFLSADGVVLSDQVELSASRNSIISLKLPFFFHDSFTTLEIIQLIKDTRVVTDTQSFPCFPGGFMYNLYEQYLNVNKYLASDLGYCTLGVFFACLCLLFNPIATAIMTTVIAIIILEVYGLLYYMGLKMNGVCVVNLVMAVGVAVEFTCYIVRAFMIESGTRKERVEAALLAMAAPTFNGGISTFLGVVTMAFAKFPYFRLYFFNMYVLIVFIGLFNGLCLLPTILCYIGPKTLSGLASNATPAAKYQTTHVGGSNTEMVGGVKKGSWVGGDDQRKSSLP